MKHAKMNDGTIIVSLTPKEVEIIAAALNSRMVHMAEYNEPWAKRVWKETLDFQCEWFEVE